MKTTAEHKKYLKLQDEARNAYRLRLIDGFDEYKKLAVQTHIEEAIKTGDLKDLEKMVKWEKTESKFEKVDGKFEETFIKAGKIAEGYIPTVSGDNFIFDSKNKQVKELFEKHIADRVTLINDSTRGVLQESIKDAFDTGKPPKKTAKDIASRIGMNEPQNRSYLKYEKSLKEQGLKQSTIDKRLETFKKNAIKQRSETIAITELSEATNKAQLESWRQANVEGFIPEGTNKKWFSIDDNRTSPVCKELNNKEVPINKEFTSSFGDFNSPPAHPRCRSGMGLVFPKSNSKLDNKGYIYPINEVAFYGGFAA